MKEFEIVSLDDRTYLAVSDGYVLFCVSAMNSCFISDVLVWNLINPLYRSIILN
jgi:hypothetical protein